MDKSDSYTKETQLRFKNRRLASEKKHIQHLLNYTKQHIGNTPENYQKLEEKLENIYLAIESAVNNQLYNEVSIFVAILVRGGTDGILITRGKWEKAKEITELLTHVTQQNQSATRLKGYYYHILGNIFINELNNAEAIQNFKAAINIFTELKDIKHVASISHQLGIISYKTGAFQEAQKSFELSLTIHSQIQNIPGIASSTYQLGILASEQNQYKLALTYYADALKLFQKTQDDKGIGFTYHSLSLVAFHQEKFELSAEYNSESYTTFLKLGDIRGLHLTLYQKGILAEQKGDTQNAEEYYLQSLTLSNTIFDWEGSMVTGMQIGSILINKKLYKQAFDYFSQSLQLSKRINSKENTAFLFSLIGNMLNTIWKDTTAAERCYKESLRLYKDLGFKAEQKKITDLLKKL